MLNSIEQNMSVVQSILNQTQTSHDEAIAIRKAAAAAQQAPTAVPDLGAAVGRRVGAPTGGGSGAGLTAPAGNVGGWINEALRVLKLDGSYANGVNNMIQRESGGNPNAINNWDSNAKAGHPSRGLMQTIPTTFAANALPGYNTNIVDPVSNIISGIRYARARYGDAMVKSGGRKNAAGNYIGY